MIDFAALVAGPCVAVFGEPAVVRRIGYDDAILSGIFDSKHYAIDDQGQAGGSALVTTFGFRVADLDPRPLGLQYLVPSDTRFTIRGTDYLMTDIHPDGQGMAVAWLERADA